MAGTFRYRMETGPEFRRLAAALRAQDREIPGELRDEIERVAKPLAADAQRKVLSIPTHGTAHSGLRARVAKGVDVRVIPTGVQIVTSMRDPGERHLPAYMDNPATGWRHPVFGNRSVWVSQHTGDNWFRDTLADGRTAFQARLHRVLEDAADTISAAGTGP